MSRKLTEKLLDHLTKYVPDLGPGLSIGTLLSGGSRMIIMGITEESTGKTALVTITVKRLAEPERIWTREKRLRHARQRMTKARIREEKMFNITPLSPSENTYFCEICARVMKFGSGIDDKFCSPRCLKAYQKVMVGGH